MLIYFSTITNWIIYILLTCCSFFLSSNLLSVLTEFLRIPTTLPMAYCFSQNLTILFTDFIRFRLKICKLFVSLNNCLRSTQTLRFTNAQALHLQKKDSLANASFFNNYLDALITACAPANLAAGTRNGEQET